MPEPLSDRKSEAKNTSLQGGLATVGRRLSQKVLCLSLIPPLTLYYTVKKNDADKRPED